MDELGIDRALMWPTLASLLEERLRDDPPATHAVIHALNQWMHEHWTFNYEDRIFPTPSSPCASSSRPSRSSSGCSSGGPGLSWSGRRRSRASWARGRWPCPSLTRSGSRSPRPTSSWACTPRTAATSATPTSGRASATARCCPSRAVGVSRPSPATRAVPSSTPWPRSSATGCAPLPDAALRSGRERQQLGPPAAGRHGELERSPTLRRGPRRGVQAEHLRPPVPRGGPDGPDRLLGADRVLFGSDYPHPEGMADPISFVDDLEGLPEKDVELVMGGNLNRLMGFGSAAA